MLDYIFSKFRCTGTFHSKTIQNLCKTSNTALKRIEAVDFRAQPVSLMHELHVGGTSRSTGTSIADFTGGFPGQGNTASSACRLTV